MTRDRRSDDYSSLGEVFLACLPEPSRQQAPSADRLDLLLSEVCAHGREAWPEVELDAGVFVAYLAEHLPADTETEIWLKAFKEADLYLACACLQKDDHALKAFESYYLSEVNAVVNRMDSSGSLGEEIRQILGHELLAGDREGKPKLAQYRGRGSLHRWVQVAAVRKAKNLRRNRRREQALDDRTLAALESPSDHELAYFKTTYREEFKSAFHEALSTLSSRERNLLRHQLLDGLSIDELGILYRVHRSTTARWLERIRSTLQSETRRVLSKRLKLAPAEFDSIVRLVMSQFDASIRRVLMEDEG